MPPTGAPTIASTWRNRIDQLGTRRPELVLAAPFMVYLLLLSLREHLPPGWHPAAIVARGTLSLLTVWLFRRHLPPWGKPHWPTALVCGVLVGWGWIVAQHWFDSLGLGGRLPLYPGQKTVVDPRTMFGANGLFWTTWTLRMTVACSAVPVVEELFWRAMVLRLLIHWDHFELVPLGQFTWLSFLGSTLLSTLQHPDHWLVSILCWMAYNALFYWKKSLLFLMLVHGVTNLALYLLALRVGDWSFW